MSVPDEAVVEPLQHDPLTGRQVMVAAVVVLAVTVLLVKLGKRTLRWDIRQYYAINKHHWCYTGLFTQVKNVGKLLVKWHTVTQLGRGSIYRFHT